MNTSENDSFKIFKGAGFLLGFALAVVGAIVVFVLSNSFAAAISAAFPIGIAMGLGLEQSFQRSGKINPIKTKTMLVSLLAGLFLFFTLYIFIKLI
jgi:hypothetical protein